MLRAIIAALVLTGCTCGAGTKYEGTAAGAMNESGTLTLTIPAPTGAPVRIKGTLRFASSSVELFGTFSPESAAMTLEGEGYRLTGKLGREALTGTYVGPKGSGTFAAQSTATSEVTLYCGTFTGGLATGVWDLNVGSDGLASGSYSAPGDVAGVVLGTITDTRLSVSCGLSCSATGSFSQGHGSGTWTMRGESGTWSGSSDCP
jgi:hypothetical protein